LTNGSTSVSRVLTPGSPRFITKHTKITKAPLSRDFVFFVRFVAS